MTLQEIRDCLERSPVIAAVPNNMLSLALESPVDIIFNLKVSILEIEECIKKAHQKGKRIFVHIDLADGIISTRAQLIRYAKETGLITVQRFFALDSKGVESIGEMLSATNPNLIEIMPGIASKIIKLFVPYNIPVIAGGLIETKQELTEALKNGAEAISTGKKELWDV